jgi:hypothetical protein
MNVMNPRRETHNDPIVDGNGKMVPRVANELRPQRMLHGPVEDSISDVVQDVLVPAAQDFDH